MTATQTGIPIEARSIDAALEEAVARHQDGDPIAAERYYRAILAIHPGHPHTSHNLGILALQTRRPAEALPCLKAACKGNPAHHQYWFSYADGLLQAGLPAEALRAMAEAARHGLRGERAEATTSRLRELARRMLLDGQTCMPDLPGDSYIRVLERLQAALRPMSYLEIGVETGATLALARCPSIGIDPLFQFKDLEVVQRIVAKPSLLLYQGPSDDFFARFDPTQILARPVDFAFLDGMHLCENLLRDFLHTERHCLPGSVIALHDCLPLEIPMAERTPGSPAIAPHRQGMWTGDVWRLALLLKRHRPDLQMTVLDAAPTGLVLITHLDPGNTLLASNYEALVEEMLGWSLETITIDNYYTEIGVEPEMYFRQPGLLLKRLRPES